MKRKYLNPIEELAKVIIDNQKNIGKQCSNCKHYKMLPSNDCLLYKCMTAPDFCCKKWDIIEH